MVDGKRKTYRHGNVRGAVLEAAMECVEQGTALTMRGLARAISVNHRSVAHEFKDLRGVKAALSEHVLCALSESLEALDVTESSVRDALIELSLAYCRYGFENQKRYEVLFGPRLNLDGRHPELEDGFQRVFAPFLAALERGRERGELRKHNSLAATLQLGSALHGYVHLICLDRWEIPDGEFEVWATSFIELPVDGLMRRLAPV